MSTDQPRRVSREVDVELTDDEKLELGAQIAAQSVEIQKHEAAISAINTTKRPMVKDLKAMHQKLHSGVEKRTLLCEVVEGPGHNISFKRPDTGEVFGTRAMTPEERQVKLAGGDWLEETQKAVEREKAKQKPGKRAGGDDEPEDDGGEDDSNVVHAPFGSGRTSAKKAARKPGKGGGKGKGRKR